MTGFILNQINELNNKAEVLIKDSSILDPISGKTRVSDILVKDGLIRSVDKFLDAGILQPAEKNASGSDKVNISSKDNLIIIDAKGFVATTSFFDMHVHLRDPGNEDEEDIESGINAAFHGGISALCCMPNTDPPLDRDYMIQYITGKARKLDFNIFPVAAMTKKMEGLEITDFGLLKESGAIALSDDGFCVQDAKLMYEIMKYSRQFDIPLILHEEDYSFSRYGLMHEGYYSSKLGLEGISSLSETLMVQRDIELAKKTKARVHFTHLSSKESVELIKKAKEDGTDITCDVTPHHLCFDDSSLNGYNAIFKVNPPLRSNHDRQALVDGIKNGIIDTISSDHAPHLETEKNTTIKNAANGVTGMETFFSSSYTQLCSKENFQLQELIKILAHKPYKILGLKPPAIMPGEKAEITLIDTGRDVKVCKEFFSSKSANSAFIDKNLKGFIFAAINGKKIRINN